MAVENRIARDSASSLDSKKSGDANVEIVCAAISVLEIRKVINRLL